MDDKKYMYSVYKYFEYKHLPKHLQGVSELFSLLAANMLENVPDNPEKAAGFRKLLEAKDCFVRASLDKS